MLDEFNDQDYLLARRIRDLNLQVEIFIDYKKHILLRGIENYKRGCHGTYFIYILASAKTLLGSIFFSDQASHITQSKARADLVDRVEEYFYRIQKTILNGEPEAASNITVKYIARILTDLLLLNNDIDFDQMNTCHYSEIIRSKISDSNLFTENQVSQIQKLFETDAPPIDQMVSSIDTLNTTFEKIIANEKYT